MKRFLSLMLTVFILIMSTVAFADTPANVLNTDTIAQLESQYAGYKVFSAYKCNESNYFVSMHKTQGRNILIWLQDGSVMYSGSGAIPQGHPVYVGNDTSCTDHEVHFSAIQAVNEDGGGINDACTVCHYFMDKRGEMRLSSYKVRGNLIGVQSNGLTYADTTVRGTVENRMLYIGVESLPRSAKAAKEKLSVAPEIPEGTLTAATVEFAAGQFYPVYSAPDSNSIRGASGKAKVSTNDWVQVFGRDGDWLMVQYDITADHFRIGYIPAKALPRGTAVTDLDFVGTAAVTNYKVTVTDDPLSSQSALIELPEDTRVLSLGTLGRWTYIEGTYDCKLFRGFVPSDSLSGSNVITSKDEARRILEGIWCVYAGKAGNADTLQFNADGTLYGDFTSANTMMTGNNWRGTWELHSYNPTDVYYWNDPEFELTVTRDNTQNRYGLRICWEPYAQNGPGYALILSDSEHPTGLVLCK